MRIQISKLKKLTSKEIKRDYQFHSSKKKSSGFYFIEVAYNKNNRYCDLYIKTTQNKISNSQVKIINGLNKNITKFRKEIESYLFSTLSNFERKIDLQQDNKGLNIDIVEIQECNNKFDFILICGKHYKYLGIFKKHISIRLEIKDGKILTMVRKKDIRNENKSG